jgi:hypothetical protein
MSTSRPTPQARELIFTANELSRCIDNISSYPSSDHIRRQLTSMWLTLVERVKLVAPEVELDAYCIDPEWPLHQTPTNH